MATTDLAGLWVESLSVLAHGGVGTVAGAMGGMADAATTVGAGLWADAATLDAGTQADVVTLARVAVGWRVVERSAVVADFMVAAVASTAAAVMVGAVDMVAADTGKFRR
jgi:hypothetical protein